MRLGGNLILSTTPFDVRSFAAWFGQCALVGVASGLAAAGLVWAVGLVQDATLGQVFGIHLEAASDPSAETSRLSNLWLLPLLPALGGLAVGVLALLFGAEVYSGGTDRVLDAYHRGHARFSWWVPVGKWLASIVTLGTGGSAGREGPMSLIGGGLGSVVGRAMRAGDRRRRLLMLAGLAAGVGSVFRVPFGGAIFAIEVLYRDGFEEEGIFPCLIASVFGYGTFVAFHGTGHLFSVPEFAAVSLSAVPLFALVGLAVVPFGYLFTHALHLAPTVFGATKLPRWLQPCAGGVIVGLLGLIHVDILGIGYGWVQQALAPGAIAGSSATLVATFLLFALGKIVATGCTVGSGGSGGTFAPSVVSGAFVGSAVGHGLALLNWRAVPEPAAFALAGMAAFLGGVAHVPLAAVVMVCELVGNYQLLVPLMLAVGTSYLLLHRTTLYPAQVANPAASLVHAGSVAADALQTLRVSDLGPLRPPPEKIAANTPLAQVVSLFAERRHSILCVTDAEGTVRQIITLRAVRIIMGSADIWPHLIAEDAARPLATVTVNDSLARVIDQLLATDSDELLVADEHGEVVGVVGHDDIARLSLHEALRRSSRSTEG